MFTTDNQLPVQVEGQADWDSAVNAAMGTLERGYHTTARAGYAVGTLDVLWLDANGFFQKYNPNSLTTQPSALAYTSAGSGDTLQALITGIVRSFAVTPGLDYFASDVTPALVVGSGTNRVGFGVAGGGLYFNPGLRNVTGIGGYVVTLDAAVNTGYATFITSGGHGLHFDPNSEAIYPHGVFLTGGTGAGSLATYLPFGYVNSLVSNGALVPGRDYFVSPTTVGLITSSYSAASRRIGRAITASNFLVNPANRAEYERLTRVVTITIAPTSTHLFTLDPGKNGWVRDLLMKSVAADKVGLAFYSNSARTNLLYQTASGGLTTVSSFTDRAGWPYENTDASTLSGILYGAIWPDTTATVASQDIQVRLDIDRWR
jgi:hypothetical protein